MRRLARVLVVPALAAVPVIGTAGAGWQVAAHNETHTWAPVAGTALTHSGVTADGDGSAIGQARAVPAGDGTAGGQA